MDPFIFVGPLDLEAFLTRESQPVTNQCWCRKRGFANGFVGRWVWRAVDLYSICVGVVSVSGSCFCHVRVVRNVLDQTAGHADTSW